MWAGMEGYPLADFFSCEFHQDASRNLGPWERRSDIGDSPWVKKSANRACRCNCAPIIFCQKFGRRSGIGMLVYNYLHDEELCLVAAVMTLGVEAMCALLRTVAWGI